MRVRVTWAPNLNWLSTIRASIVATRMAQTVKMEKTVKMDKTVWMSVRILSPMALTDLATTAKTTKMA